MINPNKYRNPRSKRKLKAKLDKQAKQVAPDECTPSQLFKADKVPSAMSPEQVLIAMAKDKHIRNEPKKVDKVQKLRKPLQASGGNKTVLGSKPPTSKIVCALADL